MSTIYECEAPGCRCDSVNHAGPMFFCRTAGMGEHFRYRDDGTSALISVDCSPACRCSDIGEFFHDAECARRLAARERARPGPTHTWDELWRSFLEHVADHGVGYGGVY